GRGFQMLSQVAGRDGGREKTGQVIIQAHAVKHRVIEQVIAHDYSALYRTEIAERQHFHYPPFYRLIQLDIKHKDFRQLEVLADKLAVLLRSVFGKRILGPETPLVGRVRNYYIKTILIKAERERSEERRV